MSAAYRKYPSRSLPGRAARPSLVGLRASAPATVLSSTNTPDYPGQLHAAILSTRESILTATASADANRNTALGGLDVARRTFADARIGLKNATAGRLVTAFLDQKLGDANETALNTVALADNANNEAVTAASAMDDAAIAIKAAAAAIETVMMDVSKIAGLTQTNDRPDAINTAAKVAYAAVQKVFGSIDLLKRNAMIANVEAARPQTQPVLSAAAANQTTIANLLNTFDAMLKASTDAVAAAQVARTTDLNNLFAQSEAFTVATSNDATLNNAVADMDKTSNDSLRAEVANKNLILPDAETKGDEETQPKGKAAQGGSKGQSKIPHGPVVAPVPNNQKIPGFKASWKLPDHVARKTANMTCFAVPFAEAASFDYQAALSANGVPYFPPLDPAPAGSDASKQTASPRWESLKDGYVHIYQDSNGNNIEFGSQYRIFALRTPGLDPDDSRDNDDKPEPHSREKDDKPEPQSATDFSFPTPPIASSVLLDFPTPPWVYPSPLATPSTIAMPLKLLPHNAFIAIFRAAGPDQKTNISSYSLFFAPTEVYERPKGAELVIADALNAASFTSIDPAQRKSFKPDDLATLVWTQVNGEVGLGGEDPGPPPPALLEWIKEKIGGEKTGKIDDYYVVYFSPFATKEGYDDKTGLYFARYTDMYGDLFDLRERAYYGLVLAVGREISDDQGTGLRAANVLSAPSTQIPMNIHPTLIDAPKTA